MHMEEYGSDYIENNIINPFMSSIEFRNFFISELFIYLNINKEYDDSSILIEHVEQFGIVKEHYLIVLNTNGKHNDVIIINEKMIYNYLPQKYNLFEFFEIAIRNYKIETLLN